MSLSSIIDNYRWTPSKQGFACSVKPPPRQDFAIFMRFLVVGAKDALAEREQNTKHLSKPLGGEYCQFVVYHKTYICKHQI